MSKPRFLKPVLIGCACLVPIGLIVGLSVNWDHTKTISSLGSAGVKPFVEAFGEEFRKTTQGYDVTVDSGGSTFGISQVANGYCNFGNSSKNPYRDIHKEESLVQSWKDSKIKTVTLGWEAVGVLYCLPDNLSEKGKKDIELYVTADNINYLLAAFSGFDECFDDDGNVQKLDTIHTSFYEFLTPKALSSLSSSDLKICKETQILPIVRSGAATVANSAFSFVEDTGLNPHITDNQYDALVGGKYGTDRLVVETDESNAKGYGVFNKYKEPGSMVYLTSAFTEKNRKIIEENKNYKFMAYKSLNSSTPMPYSFDNFTVGYDWIRPLNIMCSIDDKHSKYQDNIKFLEFIFSDQERYQKLLKDNGARSLTTQQLESMCLNNNFLVSDIELEPYRETKHKELYGAIR